MALAATTVRGADSSAVVSRDPAAKTATVVVRATVESSRGNLEEALRRDACRQAIQQVVGVQIISKTISANNIVKEFTDAKLYGFVTECKARTTIAAEGGVSIQEFVVTVKTGEVNKELLVQKVDLAVLYDVVSRPRICIAIDDKIRDSLDAEPETSTAVSSGKIIEYFRHLNPKFDFLDPGMMRRNTTDSLDAVALEQAALGNYNILVSGTTRIEPKPEPRATAVKPDLENPFDSGGSGPVKYITKISWKVIDVATKQPICYVNDQTAEASFEELASKSKVLERSVARLFRELMAHWNTTAFNTAYQIVFSANSSAQSQDSDMLKARLNTVAGLDAETIKMAGQNKGKITFDVTATGDLAEVRGSLEKKFKDKYNIVISQPGLIELAAIGGDAVATITVAVANLTATQVGEIERQLKALPEASGVDEIDFGGGRLVLAVKTTSTARELAPLLEKAIVGIKVSDYTPVGVTPARLNAMYMPKL